jgi:hypothetical protein
VGASDAAESRREPKLGDEYLRWQATRFATRLADESAARSAPLGTMIWANRAALGAGGRNGTNG